MDTIEKMVSVVLEGRPDIMAAVAAARVVREDHAAATAGVVRFRTRVRLRPCAARADQKREGKEEKQRRTRLESVAPISPISE